MMNFILLPLDRFIESWLPLRRRRNLNPFGPSERDASQFQCWFGLVARIARRSRVCV